MLYLPTCVGLRYGRPTVYLEGFLVSVGSATSIPNDLGITPRGGLKAGPADLPTGPPYGFAPGRPTPGWPTLLRHPIAPIERYGNVDPLPITYAFRPRLRGRLTLSGVAFLRKP